MTSKTNERSKKLNWSIFVISTAICVLLLVIAPQWFWVPLPFVLTYLVRGLDMM